MVKAITHSHKYNIVNGTSYHLTTPTKVINLLEMARLKDTRIRVCYGDTTTGRDWKEIYDVSGRIGRSTGTYHIPILLKRVDSHGGGGLLDHCIVRIEFKSLGVYEEVYKHPKYHMEDLVSVPIAEIEHFL